jgi:ribosomal protein S13
MGETRRLQKQRGGVKTIPQRTSTRTKNRILKIKVPSAVATKTQGIKKKPEAKDIPALTTALGAHMLTASERVNAREEYPKLKQFKQEDERVKELAEEIAPLADLEQYIKEKPKKARELFEYMNVEGQCSNVIGSPKKGDKCYICGYKVIPGSPFFEFRSTCEHLLPIRNAILLLDVLPYKDIAEGGTVFDAGELLKNPMYKSMISLEYKWAHQLCNLVKLDYLMIEESDSGKFTPDTDKINKMIYNINVKFTEYGIEPVSINDRVKEVKKAFQEICDYLNERIAPKLNMLAAISGAALRMKHQKNIREPLSMRFWKGSRKPAGYKAASGQKSKTRKSISKKASASLAKESGERSQTRKVSAAQKSRQSQAKKIQSHRTRGKAVAAAAAAAAAAALAAEDFRPPSGPLPAIPSRNENSEGFNYNINPNYSPDEYS